MIVVIVSGINPANKRRSVIILPNVGPPSKTLAQNYFNDGSTRFPGKNVEVRLVTGIFWTDLISIRLVS